MSKLDNSFYQKLLQLSSKVGMKPEDILNVMAVESNLDPSAHNPNGHASGLVQVMPKFLSGLGFKGSPEDFRNSSATNQLNVVEKLIEGMIKINGGPLTSAAQYYVGNLLPVALKLPGVRQGRTDTIILSKNPNIPHLPNISLQQEIRFYNANSGLDFDHDGNITYGDIQNILKSARNKKSYQNAILELSKVKNILNSDVNVTLPKHNNISELLTNYLSLINAEEVKMTRIYKPSIIKVIGNSFNESLEFARILCLALDEELSFKSSIHYCDNTVELEFNTPKNLKVFNAIQQLSNSLAEVFFETTKKIGGVKVGTQVISNKRSSYQTVDLKTVESEHRKFLLKFV